MSQKNSHKRINDAINILTALGIPKAQQNERSALCLLALLNLTPNKKWGKSENPLMGITPIMDWARALSEGLRTKHSKPSGDKPCTNS